MRRILIGGLMALCLAAPALAADCQKAEKYWAKAEASIGRPGEKGFLEKTLTLCPNHIAALNNLAAVYEREGKLELATSLYLKSLKADPSFLAPWAGLGDIAMAQGRFTTAVKHYTQLLDGMPREKASGDPYGLLRYEGEYRDKLARCRLKAGIHEESMNQVVGRQAISRGLEGNGMRGPGGRKVRERVALAIKFDYDSAALKPMSREQLVEVAASLKSPMLASRHVTIEGHTDTFGGEAYNLALSRRRARAVSDYLAQQGISPQRLSIVARGEALPLAKADTREGQAKNRRVEFVVR